MDPTIRRTGMTAGAVIVLGILLWFAWPGVHAYFNDDDIMNLRNALQKPTSELILTTLDFAPDAYRPVGLLWYKGMLATAGLNPLPFRIVSFLILLFNLLLLCAFTFALTSSAEVTLLAALIGCFHSRMDNLYFSSANIYDILCYTFYFAALLYYVRRRHSSLPLGVGQVLLIIFLQILALGAKEMAVTLPAILVAYELAYGVQWSRRSGPYWKRWWMEVGACLAGTVAISALFCVRKLLGPGTILNEAYRPVYSVAFAFERWSGYFGLMLHRNDPVPLAVLVIVLVSVLVIAIALRSKPLIVCSTLILIGPLPVLFVEQRPLNMQYIPMTGWAIFLAVLLVWSRERITSVLGHPAVGKAALFLCAAALLCIAHHADRPDHTFPRPGRVKFIQPFLEELRRVHPALPEDAHVLLLNDPFPPEEWGALSIVQLFYRRPELDIASYKVSVQRAEIPQRKFNVVFTWRDGHLIYCENGLNDDPPCRLP